MSGARRQDEALWRGDRTLRIDMRDWPVDVFAKSGPPAADLVERVIAKLTAVAAFADAMTRPASAPRD